MSWFWVISTPCSPRSNLQKQWVFLWWLLSGSRQLGLIQTVDCSTWHGPKTLWVFLLIKTAKQIQLQCRKSPAWYDCLTMVWFHVESYDVNTWQEEMYKKKHFKWPLLPRWLLVEREIISPEAPFCLVSLLPQKIHHILFPCRLSQILPLPAMHLARNFRWLPEAHWKQIFDIREEVASPC